MTGRTLSFLRGLLVCAGYAGDTAEDHLKHLYAMHSMLERVTEGGRSSGEHLLFWNPSTLSSGAYFLPLRSGREAGVTHKVIVLR